MEQQNASPDRVSETIANSVILRIFIIGFLVVLLLIPLFLIQSMVSERQMTYESVLNDVSSKWGQAQVISGPFVVVPYQELRTTKDANNISITENVTDYAYFLPEKLNIIGKLNTEQRQRGIYQAVVYTGELQISGTFNTPSFDAFDVDKQKILWSKATINLGVTDMRGIDQSVDVDWNGQNVILDPGVQGNAVYSGVSNNIVISADTTKGEYKFSFTLKIKGSKAISFLPLGKETNVELSSAWAHPSFSGQYLPDTPQVSDSGFKASWNVLHLNRNYPQQWTGTTSYEVGSSAFGVDLLIPVDQYQKTTRSVKYGLMTIALTFLVFFFVEILNKIRIHPIQYGLVGLALVLFYTLLLSISEHLSFNLAYFISAAAVITLIAVYSRGMFRNTRHTTILTLVLVFLYGFLYTTLQLEDYALLMGSLVLFGILAAVMYFSRNIDWYDVTKTKKEA